MNYEPSRGQTTKLACSQDGLAWDRPSLEPVLTAEAPWEGSYALTKAVRLVGDQIWLYYFGKRGVEEAIGLAVSADMKHFRKHEGNPIFVAADSSLAGQRVFPDCTVQDGSMLYLFYDIGWDYDHSLHPRAYSIAAARSVDGITLADAPGNPMLCCGPQGAWDSGSVCHASVVRIGDWWYMLYAAWPADADGKNKQSFGLARARRPLGPWEKFPGNPVFVPSPQQGAWDGAYLQHPCPVLADGQWRLYYTGNDGRVYAVGLAISERQA